MITTSSARKLTPFHVCTKDLKKEEKEVKTDLNGDVIVPRYAPATSYIA